MKHFEATQIRITISVPSLTIGVGTDKATNVAPFLVKAKASYEPEILPLEDDPGCPEWFAFDTLYVLQETHLFTKDGVCVTVQPHSDLMLLLTETQLEIIEGIVLHSFKGDNYVY